MQPYEDPTELPEPSDQETADDHPSVSATEPQDSGRLVIALLAYACLAILAGIRLEGRPRLVVWLFLGLFAVKTLLAVRQQRND